MFDVKELDCIFMYRFAKQSVFTVILIPLPAGMILSLHILMLLKGNFSLFGHHQRIQDKDGIFWRGNTFLRWSA